MPTSRRSTTPERGALRGEATFVGRAEQRGVGLLRQLTVGERPRELLHGGAVLRGERCERVEVEAVEPRGVAREHVTQLGLGNVVEDRAQRLARVRARAF